MDFDGGQGSGDAGAGGDAGGTGSVADILGGAASAGAGEESSGSSEVDGGQGGGDAGGGMPDPDWYNSLSAEADGESASNRDWIKAKGFKDLDSVTKALRHAEKAIHDSGRIKVPGEGAAPEEVGAFHRAIGVPEDPKGYTIEAPKDAQGNPLPLDAGLLDVVTAAGVKHGVPKAALEAVLADVFKHDLDQIAGLESRLAQEAQEWVRAQGANISERQAAVDNAAVALGLTREDMTKLRGSLGPARALNLLAKIGDGISEDRMISGGRGRFAVSGAEAQAELDKLKGDPAFYAKAQVKGTPENLRWNRLNEAVAAEEERRRRAG